MSPVSFQVVKGDTTKLCIHCVDSDGNPLRLDSFEEITFTLKRSTGDPDIAAVFQGTETDDDIEVISALDGICEVTVPASASATLLLFRTNFWDLKLTSDAGSISTVAYGTITAILSSSVSL